tara:strand:+ start:228 stop:491 length:264 start_codon:yes stop_codon:yes gene_type:complete
MSQKKKVISWLKSGRTLTPLEALSNGMGMRLGAIIHTLRHEEDMDIRNLNKSGKDRHAEYKLIPEKPKEEPEPSLELGNTNRFRYPD